MATASINGADIYYEVQGSGEPVVLVMGLGASVLAWREQIPALSRHYQVVAFDNRGAGRSDKPERGYSIPLMAGDAFGVMDAVGIDSAHIFGVSMGGMIAQEMYHSHPDRVRSLILAGTLAGGPMAKLPSPANLIAAFTTPDEGTLDGNIFQGLRLLYSDSYIEANRDQIVRRAISQFAMLAPPHALRGQSRALRRYNAYSKLPQIEAPTLIFGATDDKIVPFANQQDLARRIPNAEFIVLEGAGHGFIIERAEAVNRATLAFLREHSGAGVSAA